MEDLQKELEEQRELATNRLSELDRLHQNHRDVLQQLEHLKMDVSRRFFTLEQWPDSCRCRSITHRVVMADFHARAIDERRILSLSLSLSLSVSLWSDAEQIRQLPESVVVETTEYKCLQSQFSVLYNESMALKTQLDEARQQWHNAKNTHLRQIEQMESDELLRQKQLRSEVIQLEDMLAQVPPPMLLSQSTFFS